MLKIRASRRDDDMISEWHRGNPDNVFPLPDWFGVVRFDDRLVACPLKNNRM